MGTNNKCNIPGQNQKMMNQGKQGGKCGKPNSGGCGSGCGDS